VNSQWNAHSRDTTGLVVVLVDTRNPLNIGAAARAMSNFGFATLRVVRPYEPSFREARSAVGASDLLQRTEQFATVAEAIADRSFVIGTTAARDRNVPHALQTPAHAATLIRQRMRSGRVALLFGSEKRGLSNDDLSRCHAILRIPARTEHSSMNLGQAVAICLYELIRENAAAHAVKEVERATQVGIHRLERALFDALLVSGYVQPGTETTTEVKLRRLLRRLALQSPDADVLTGMFRQILWKLRSSSDEKKQPSSEETSRSKSIKKKRRTRPS
jgi:tRNA/rRNA methyltransferase